MRPKGSAGVCCGRFHRRSHTIGKVRRLNRQVYLCSIELRTSSKRSAGGGEARVHVSRAVYLQDLIPQVFHCIS